MKIHNSKMHMLHEPYKEVEPSIRSELLIAYTEFTINFEKFISVAGSLYL